MSNAARYLAVVAVPTFNASRTIESTLASIVRSIEFHAARSGATGRVAISVVDDASTDGTVSLLEACASSAPCDVIVTALPVNRGRAHARNRALAAVDAAHYFFLDHDDEYHPPHITICLDALATDPHVDYVKTGVELSEPVHPEWEPRIAASLTQNLCVRAYCHRLVGGFHEEPDVETFGCDDVLYNRTLRACLRGSDLPAKTVRFWRRPGNSFDRQFDRKFSRPVSESEVTLSPRQLELRPHIAEIHDARLQQVRRRVRHMARAGRAFASPKGEARTHG